MELTGEPLVQFYCHCDDCQAVHGAAYAPESVYPTGGPQIVGRQKCLRYGGLPREHCQSSATTLWRTQAILKYSPSLGLIAVFAIIS
jgi:hypothetical protein